MLQPAELVNDKLVAISRDFFTSLPNIIAGLVFLLIAWLLGKLVRRFIAFIATRRGRPDLGNVAGSLTQGAFMIAAILVAAAIIFPSVQPADVLATLGIGSIAIGFAFKDVLQNLLAGLLILVRRPYTVGDQIVVDGYEGTVEHIESRATMIRTYDNRRVVIPNADVYTKAVIVLTAYASRRDQYDVGIGYGDDPMLAAEVFRQAIRDVPGVQHDPLPECFPWELAESTVNLRARWWVSSTRTDVVHTRARVLAAIYRAAKDNSIDLPFPTQVMLFHDQTEDVDGDRTAQREGWPAGESPPNPAGRRRGIMLEEATVERESGKGSLAG
ncbi:mechanosensitive ion channel protein MscS [Pacificimonas flava]|uniref:Small-conductance mechanosensitive channel n=1 Tax=Pacificimonas flava TaxID=1234595 RepID=A0A219B8S6_9SPHN|nr:mechanosensitive ion channel protein MscS [Pacificimonas flava]